MANGIPKRINCSLSQNKKSSVCKKRPRPLINYFGGKQRAADKIISTFPNHKVYVEPFVGGGAVYWKNTVPDKFVINDLNKDIITPFKTAKNNPSSIKKCDLNNMNKTKFHKIRAKSDKSACEVIKLHKHGFSGNPQSYANKGKKKFNNQLTDKHTNKLKKTTILNQDFKNVMKKYDSKNTLHYLDPPYIKEGHGYINHGVLPQEVCSAAKKMKGKVVISYDNHPDVKKACKGMKFRKIKFPYSARNNGKKGTELLITNY